MQKKVTQKRRAWRSKIVAKLKKTMLGLLGDLEPITIDSGKHRECHTFFNKVACLTEKQTVGDAIPIPIPIPIPSTLLSTCCPFCLLQEKKAQSSYQVPLLKLE